MSGKQKDKLHITETPDTSHIKNIDVTHEKSDVDVGSIAKFVIGLLVLTIVTFIGLWGMFRMLQRSETHQEQTQHRSPLAPTADERKPPEPRLQGAPGFAESLEKAAPGQHEEQRIQTTNKGFDPPKDPLWEIKVLRKQWDHVLEHGPTDEHGQRFGMPIEQAKEEVLKQLEKQKAESKRQ
ncbi:MAG TPA: hypothetical protein VIT19_09375 [Pyrinomonadaceae bacterium]